MCLLACPLTKDASFLNTVESYFPKRRAKQDRIDTMKQKIPSCLSLIGMEGNGGRFWEPFFQTIFDLLETNFMFFFFSLPF